MDEGLENAAIALRNKMLNIQIVANNLANLNTTGFKKGLAFSEVFDEENANLERKLTDFSEGVFEETNNPLNLAISGDAFFTVLTPEGEQLTRCGDFIIDPQGFLSTREGYHVLGQSGEINLQEEVIDENGAISITKNGILKSNDRILEKLKISKVNNNYTLTKDEGQRFYNEEKTYDLADDRNFEIHQGYLESSNTNAILEMQQMIQLQNDFEASYKMVTSIDSTLSQLKDIGEI